MPAITRYAVYSRVSTDEQDDADLSLPRQRRLCQEWVSERGGVIVAYYEDDGISSTTPDRPQLQDMLAAAERKEFDRIIVYKSNRLARGEDLPSVLRYLFGRHKVTIESVSERHFAGNEMTDAVLRMAETMAGTMWIEGLRADVRAGLEQVFVQGRGHGVAPYGYRNLPRVQSGRASKSQGWAIIPTEAEIVRRIYGWYIDEGLNYDQIAKRLNHAGVPSPVHARRGEAISRWERSTIAVILKQSAYAGYVERHGQRREGTHEAILDRDRWEVAQRLREQRGRGATVRGGSLFSGGLLVCPHCGTRLIMASSKLRTNTKEPALLPDGFRNPAAWIRYYRCQSYSLALRYRALGWPEEAIPKCPGYNISEHVALALLTDYLKGLLRRARGKPVVVSRPHQPAAPAEPDTAREAEQLDAMRKRILWQHAEGIINDSELQSQIAQIEARRAQMRALTPQPAAPIIVPAAAVTDLITALHSPDIPTKLKRDALKAGIDHISPSADRTSAIVIWRA